ncbi:hypothetical protein E3P99_02564 [Wallemia hederae]|uniref:Uncharacterized protein n=1 Tax=Wallemia hederae TaxID=1540922 RepID=A0A4T0FK18_9BASI|nr:hypothetical protein E3P99_02564 [Wallemia hederae]
MTGDLSDRELAEILTRDSLAGAESSNTQPRAINQRFLLNTLRSVDEHNRGTRTSSGAGGSAGVGTSSDVKNTQDESRDHRTSDSRSFADFSKKKRKREDKGDKRRKKESKESAKAPKSNPFESKMDKYFERDYDPSTDYNLPDDANDEDFDSWNVMLENVRERNKLKQEREAELWEEEKKRERDRENQKLGREKAKIAKLLGPEAEKEYQRRRKEEKRARKEQAKESIKNEVINSVQGGSDLMAMEYGKKGSTRAWDVGKK